MVLRNPQDAATSAAAVVEVVAVEVVVVVVTVVAVVPIGEQYGEEGPKEIGWPEIHGRGPNHFSLVAQLLALCAHLHIICWPCVYTRGRVCYEERRNSPDYVYYVGLVYRSYN